MISNYGKIFFILGIIVIILIIFFCTSKNNITFESYTRPKETYKLNVIIPIRNREKELDKITDVLEKIFKIQNIEAKYFIIEQEDGKKFNKGLISNIGFLEASKKNYCDNYLFNDVDLYPKNEFVIDYRENVENKIRHPYGNKVCLGGFFLMSGHIFKKLNGYATDFWGWGSEDTDLQNRATILNVLIDRKNYISRYSNQQVIVDDISYGFKKRPSQHKIAQKKCKQKYKKYKKDNSTIKDNGLTTTKYHIISRTQYKNKPNMTRIIVKI